MFAKTILVTLGAASAALALVPRGVCNADNCLRALKATSPKTRLAQAEADCAAWLTVTSTPIATATAYTTILDLTETIVEQITTTNTVYDTFTSTVHKTPTETVYTSTVTTTVEPIVVVTKRANVAPTIPLYATPCSGAVRYSSACSCLGVSVASTITAPTSTITVTLPTTASTSVQATSVVATSVTVVYDTTVTETVTEPTITVSTVTTATVTKSAEPTARAVKIAIDVPGRAPGYVSNYESSGISYAIYTADASLAISLTLQPDGTLWFGNKVAKGDVNGGRLAFFFVEPQVAPVRKAHTCNVDDAGILTCQVGTAGNNKFGLQTQSTGIPVIYSAKLQDFPAAYYAVATLKVV